MDEITKTLDRERKDAIMVTKDRGGISSVTISTNTGKPPVTLSGEQWDDAVERMIAGFRTILTDGEPDARATIPGTMEFAGDFKPAPLLETIGEALIGNRHELEHLTDVPILYLWKKKGGSSGGRPTFGKCQLAKGLVGYLADDVRFVVWIAADNAFLFTNWELEAQMFNLLLHTTYDDEEGVYGLRPPEFSGFVAELDRYGAWQADLIAMARQAQQMRFPLPDDNSDTEDE